MGFGFLFFSGCLYRVFSVLCRYYL